MTSGTCRTKEDVDDSRIAKIALQCVPAISFFSFVSTSLGDIVSIVFTGISLFLIFKKPDSRTNTPVILAALWISYLIFSAAYATQTNSPGDHWRGIGKYCFIAIGFLATVPFSLILSRDHLKKDTLVLLFLTGLVGGGAFVLVRNGAADFLAHGWADSMDSLGKLNRNYVGLICSLSIISISGLIYFLCSQANIRWARKMVIIAALAFLLFCEVILLARTQSRTSYFATAAAMTIWAFTILIIDRQGSSDKKALMRKLIIPLAIVAAVTGLLAAYFPLISTRFDLGFVSQLSLDHLSINSALAKAASTSSDADRLRLISVALDLINQRPWFGWGPDATRLIDTFSPYPSIRNLIQFHNGYMQTLVSFGIVGTTFLTILIVAGIRFAILRRTTSQESARLSKIFFATLLALVVYILIANVTESILMVKAPAMICLFVIAIACARPAPASTHQPRYSAP
ncbi:MAG TPA: O-antigen ligase family protein [Afipia sp.]